MNVVCVVQARMGSRRLRGKVLMPAGERPMLAHLLSRLDAARSLTHKVIATSDRSSDDAIAEFCASEGRACFRGSENDVLQRIAGAARAFHADLVVRVTGDCPLIDPTVVDAVVAAAAGLCRERGDDNVYAANVIERTYPRGMDVEVFGMTSLIEADERVDDPVSREHVTTSMIRNSDLRLAQASVCAPENLSAFRFTLDYRQDYEQLKAIIEDPFFDVRKSSYTDVIAIAQRLGVDLLDTTSTPEVTTRIKLSSRGSRQARRIILGGAQFGMNYGRFNRHGVVSEDAADAILKAARDAGISLVDTAQVYGISESALGGAMERVGGVSAVTKIAPQSVLAFDGDAIDNVVSSLRESEARLGVGKIDSVLFHDAQDLWKPGIGKLIDALRLEKARGRFRRLGVSVYDARTALRAWSEHPIEILQVPFSVFDQRVIQDRGLEDLREHGVEIHARSIFLQGLLLADPAQLPGNLARAITPLQLFRDWCESRGRSCLEVALAFALQQRIFDRVVVGVESLAQLQQILASIRAHEDLDLAHLAVNDMTILNPIQWGA